MQLLSAHWLVSPWKSERPLFCVLILFQIENCCLLFKDLLWDIFLQVTVQDFWSSSGTLLWRFICWDSLDQVHHSRKIFSCTCQQKNTNCHECNYVDQTNNPRMQHVTHHDFQQFFFPPYWHWKFWVSFQHFWQKNSSICIITLFDEWKKLGKDGFTTLPKMFYGITFLAHKQCNIWSAFSMGQVLVVFIKVSLLHPNKWNSMGWKHRWFHSWARYF